MKILLTGANGMLGSAITEQLSKTNHTLLATGKGELRHNHLIFNEKSNYASLDITDQIRAKHLFDSFKPDAIIHSAAMTQVDDCELNKDQCYSINTASTMSLISLAKEVNAAFHFISTDFVFSGDDGPYVESDQIGPVNYYGETKELAEQYLIQSGLNWSIIRTVLLYGKTDQIKRSNFIYWVRDSLVESKPIKVVNDQIRTPTYIPDLAKGIIKAVEGQAKGIYHISGDEIMTPYQMAIEVARFLKLDEQLITPVDATTFTQPGKRPQRTGFYIKKAIDELGYAPTAFKTALAEIFS